MESDSFIAWASAADQPGLSIIKPFDGNDACIGNGVMIALGATDEGAPGNRGDGFYVGYFRDLDGNKLNFFSMPSAD